MKLGRMETLKAGHYRTVVVDPPWPGPGKHRSQKGNRVTLIPYQTMTGIQIASMNIKEICAPDAKVWLWATTRSLGDAFLLLRTLGFSWGGMFIWKKPPNLGARIRHDSEFLLLGCAHNAPVKYPAPQQTHAWKKPKRHSEKPAEAYAMIADQSPGPRIDIFGRQNRPGFECWGNEAPQDACSSLASCVLPSCVSPDAFIPTRNPRRPTPEP